ncbi:MAG: nucleotide sugar dehydrogenase [Desulfobulbaceae bacterium]|nr:nucleotide sugar dehydrogenase [Desulfobulbaceae bacterium]
MLKLADKIRSRSARIGIVGLGYVGLPLAVAFSEAGFSVLGFDTQQQRVDLFNQGKSYIADVSDECLSSVLSSHNLEATVNQARLAEMDAICICVPTPLSMTREPDLSYVISEAEEILAHLRKEQLVILESTTYPGTTREMLLPILERSGLKGGSDFYLAFSPERVDPGSRGYNIKNTPKVVGGINAKSTEMAALLYRHVADTVVSVSCPEVAEMTKVFENVFRSVNIALVNELAQLCERMNISVWQVINAATTKPFGYMPFFPGPGLGGHCIPIDPFYLAWKAREYDFDARFIHLAGEVNIAMPGYVVERTAEALASRGKELQGSRILVLGIAYKKDIADDRESPGYAIMDMLTDRGALVSYNDPWIPKLRPTRKYNFTHESIELTPELLTACDAVIIVTDHTAYDYGEIVSHARLVVDTRNSTVGLRNGLDKVVLA